MALGINQINDTDPIFRAGLTRSLNCRRNTQPPRPGSIQIYNQESVAEATKQSLTNYIDLIG